jgi:hypothetical protein
MNSSKTSLNDDSKFELIKFDNKVKFYISILIVLFAIFVFFKLHNSSIPFWNEFFPSEGSPKLGLISGEPLSIRSDEWMVQASNKLSQSVKGFPISNEALGFGNSALVMGLPTVSLLSKMIPSFWGYYILDIERAYSWAWNFSIFLFLISSFLFFMLFTNNQFYLSIFGSLWIFLSTAIQWWSINTDLFAFGFSSVVLAVYLVFSSNFKNIIILSILLTISIYNFWIFIYPAYQVPLAYLLLALFIGYFLKNKSTLKIHDKINIWKSLSFIVVLALNFILFYFYYSETKETIEVMVNTVYPGKRFETGGTYPFLRMFSENYFYSTKVNHIPPEWNNICETSSFLMISPLASVFLFYDTFKSKKIDPILLCTLIYILFVIFYILVGFPKSIAKVSLFYTSPSIRAFYIYGFANIVFTIIYLSHRSTQTEIPKIKKITLFIVLIAASIFLNYFLNRSVDMYFSIAEVVIASFIFILFNWLVIGFGENKKMNLVHYVICILVLVPNLSINPLSQGLEPYTSRKLYKEAKEIALQEPNAVWNVYGQYQLTGFLKAAGVNTFNGVQYSPPLKKLYVLDPDKRYQDVYNRYAHITLKPNFNQKKAEFKLIQPDLYEIKSNPCSSSWKEIGVKYSLFTNSPSEEMIKCMTLVKKINNLSIYKYKDL